MLMVSSMGGSGRGGGGGQAGGGGVGGGGGGGYQAAHGSFTVSCWGLIYKRIGLIQIYL